MLSKTGFTGSAHLVWRYLWRSPRPVTQWLIGLSFVGLMLSAWAWVVVSSVFNGFSSFLEEVFQRVDPQVRIVGMGLSDSLRAALERWPAVEAVAGVYERIGVLKYGQRQVVVRVRLVDSTYARVSRIGTQLIYGESFPLARGSGLIGSGVAARAAVLDAQEGPVWLYIVSSGRGILVSGLEGLLRRRLAVQGIFSVQKEYDDSWVIALQSDWPEVRGAYDVLELRLRAGNDPRTFLKKLQPQLPPGLVAQDPREQHEGLFRILAQEKALARFGLLWLIGLTVSGALSTLSTFVLQNRRDWALYRVLGASRKWVERLLLGISVTLLGTAGVAGAALGAFTVWTQERFQWAKLRGGEDFLLSHFPVRLNGSDFLWLSVILLAIALALGMYMRYQLRSMRLREALQGE